MSRIKALFVLASLGGGGAERVTLHLLRHLDRSQFTPSLVLLKGHDDYVDLLPNDVPVHRLGVRRARYASLPLAHLINRVRPDLLFSTAVHVDESVCLAVKLSRCTPEVILRSSNYSSMSLRTAPFHVRHLAKWSYRSADMIIASTQAMKLDMEQKFRLSSKCISVIPNPVDLSMVQSSSKESVSHPWFQRDAREKHPLIIGMGRLEPQKGFKYLIEAFSRVAAKIEARLAILGRGPQMNELKKLSKELDIASDVVFMGFQRNPYKFLANADLFVLSSLWEGFPNALVEAMACGIPVISTDCPSGPSEIITPKVNSLLVPTADPEALAEGVLRVLRDKGIAAKSAKAGKERAMDFKVTGIVEKYEKVFRECHVSGRTR